MGLDEVENAWVSWYRTARILEGCEGLEGIRLADHPLMLRMRRRLTMLCHVPVDPRRLWAVVYCCGHAWEPDSWRRLASGVISNCGCLHLFPIAVEKGPLVLSLVCERSHAAVGPVKLSETCSGANLAPRLSGKIHRKVKILILDPHGQFLVVVRAARAELSVDVAKRREVNEAVHVLRYVHDGRAAVGGC